MTVVTSFCVVFVVLIASFCVPVFAASFTVYDPADYITRITADGNIITTQFVFPSTPMFYLYDNGTPPSSSYTGSFDFQVDPDWTSVLIRAFPFGTFRSGGEMAAGYVVDLADFKKNSVLSVVFDTTFRINYTNRWENSGPDSSGFFNSSATFLFYDLSGNYIGSVASSGVVTTVYMSDNSGSEFPLLNTFEVTIPDDAVYMIPTYRCNFVLPTGAAVVTSVSSAGNPWFGVRTTSDAVIEQTETMNAIEEQLQDLNDNVSDTNDKLDDLNEKTDTLINGTPEMEQAAQDAAGFAQDQYEEANRVEELEKEYLQDFEESSQILNDKVTEFVDGIGFNQLTALVVPIMNWEHSGLIMLLVIAFINMSVILFGR